MIQVGPASWQLSNHSSNHMPSPLPGHGLGRLSHSRLQVTFQDNLCVQNARVSPEIQLPKCGVIQQDRLVEKLVEIFIRLDRRWVNSTDRKDARGFEQGWRNQQARDAMQPAVAGLHIWQLHLQAYRPFFASHALSSLLQEQTLCKPVTSLEQLLELPQLAGYRCCIVGVAQQTRSGTTRHHALAHSRQPTAGEQGAGQLPQGAEEVHTRAQR